MKKIFLLLAVILPFIVRAQTPSPIRLWAGDAPGALGTADKDIPTLTPYLPKAGRASGAAMVICPGGGYGHLAKSEGEDYALWLNDHGITGFVLKYRLGPNGYRHPAPLQDASRAIRFIRANATKWNIDPHRVGIIGSSAGGHLASTLMTHFDSGKPDAADPIERQSSRPDLGILCYPVITMGEKGHKGSRHSLLGDAPSPELIKNLSNELQVTKDTPPCFLYHSTTDRSVPVENSLMFAEALRKAGVPFDLHIYENGTHGSGLGLTHPSNYDPQHLHPWTTNCIYWLQQHGFVKN